MLFHIIPYVLRLTVLTCIGVWVWFVQLAYFCFWQMGNNWAHQCMEIALENKSWLLDVMILFVFVPADEIHVQVLFKLVEIWNVFWIQYSPCHFVHN